MNQEALGLVDAAGMIVPEVVLVAGACVLFVGATFYRCRHIWATGAMLTVAAAGFAWWFALPAHMVAIGSCCSWLVAPAPELSLCPFRHDGLTWLIKGVSLAAGLVFIWLSWNQVPDRQAAEYHACLLLIVAGVNLVAAANDLVSLFLALELISIPTYILLYLPRFDAQSQEAATKYFLLSVFSSALLLYGFSLLYGSVGSTNLEVIKINLQTASAGQLPGLLLVALVMIVAGLGFRITAVPFHFYAPDVFQGTPTGNAALLAFIPKVAGFVALVRVVTVTLLVGGPAPSELGGSLGPQGWTLGQQAQLLLWILAAVTMFLGNFLALLQDNLKRLLAYSSVAHAGYMLIGLGVGRAGTDWITGIEALFFYLVVYGAMTVGAFAVLVYLNRTDRPVETIDDLAGLGWSHPITALVMTLFLFSLTGLPPTAGFWGKFYLFFAAWSAPGAGRLFQVLAVLLAINAAIGAWYYLRIVGVMYLRQAVKPLPQPQEQPARLAILICAMVTGGLFLVPSLLWRLVREITL